MAADLKPHSEFPGVKGACAAPCLHSRGPMAGVPEALARGGGQAALRRELPPSLCWPPGFLLGWALRPEKPAREVLGFDYRHLVFPHGF